MSSGIVAPPQEEESLFDDSIFLILFIVAVFIGLLTLITLLISSSVHSETKKHILIYQTANQFTQNTKENVDTECDEDENDEHEFDNKDSSNGKTRNTFTVTQNDHQEMVEMMRKYSDSPGLQ
eukprot:187989_1